MTFLSRIIKSEHTILEDGRLELYKSEEESLVKEDNMIHSLNQDTAVMAEEDIDELLEKARKRAEKSAAKILEEAYAKRDRIVNLASKEAGRLKLQAVMEGEEAGKTQALGMIAETLNKIEAALKSLGDTMRSNEESLNKEVISLSLAIASRIMAKRIREDENEMIELVQEAVRTEKDKKHINIYISEEMMGLIEHLDKEMESVRERYQNQIRVKPAKLPKGGVRVETEEGIMDASVFIQLDNLKRQLQILDSDS